MSDEVRRNAYCWACQECFSYTDVFQRFLCADCLENISLFDFRAILNRRGGRSNIEVMLAREELEEHLKKRDEVIISNAMLTHRTALKRNFRKALIFDDFGGIQKDGRAKVAEQFIKASSISLEVMTTDDVVEFITKELKNFDNGNTAEISVPPTDGIEFEHWVADVLMRYGWQVQVTQGSGDQGIDVIAHKEGVSLGIQCKCYTGSVGNKAVQEALSGAIHMGLENAAVLTNASFSRSAKELAASTAVLLLYPDDIPNLLEILTERVQTNTTHDTRLGR